MRLLRSLGEDNFRLVEYVGRDVPPYAILSHTWGKDEDEVTFRDIIEGTGKSKAGYSKLEFCGAQAHNDGLEYFWVDTCCIDKSSSAELSEAINSMFKWYKKAAVCYVFLTDVSNDQTDPNAALIWLQSFTASRWFTRGWTLQELLAPGQVRFFSKEGVFLGDKTSLVDEISKITRISEDILKGRDINEVGIEVRMSWAENRTTKREEDEIYSLLGLFDIYMPLIYGEGRQRALSRLQKELREIGGFMLSNEDLRKVDRQQYEAFLRTLDREKAEYENFLRNQESKEDEEKARVETQKKRIRETVSKRLTDLGLGQDQIRIVEDELSTQHGIAPVEGMDLEQSMSNKFRKTNFGRAREFAMDPRVEADGPTQLPPTASMPMWPGNHLESRVSKSYLQHRNALAAASKFGDWNKTLRLLEIGQEEYGENWANVVRIRPAHEAHRISFWSLLHQAAYMSAPINVIKYLLDRGALRTMRTRKQSSESNLAYEDLTALDIARDMQATNLLSILAPVIHHPVPHRTIGRLQALFHEMIRADLEDADALILPDLEPLMELKYPEMWFPIKGPTEGSDLMGYQYRLDDRELVVMKLSIEKESPAVYRIR